MTTRLGHSGNRFASVGAADQNPAGVSWLTNEQITNNTRIPFLQIVGTKMLQVMEQRNAQADGHCHAFGLRISTNDGASWSGPPQEILNANPPTSSSTLRNASPVISPPLANGDIYLLYTRWTNWTEGNGFAMTPRVYYKVSNVADPTTWSAETEITVDVVKQTNLFPTNLPNTLKGTSAAWCSLVATDCVLIESGPNAGRLVFFCYYRYLSAQVSRGCTICREPNGTWKILGGFDDQNATFDGINEPTASLLADGTIRTFYRFKNSDLIYKGLVVDDGATMGVTGGASFASTGIQSAETQYRVVSNPANRNEIVLLGVSDGIRAIMRAWHSTNGGTTLPAIGYLINDLDCSYPAAVIKDGRLTVHYEAGHNLAGNGGINYAETKQFTCHLADLDGPPDPIWFQFNERPSGAMLAGPSLFSRGMDVRGNGNTAWDYTAAGIRSDGSTACIINPARTSTSWGNAFAFRMEEDFTFEVLYNPPSLAAGHVIASNYNGSSGRGWELRVAANGVDAELFFRTTGAGQTIANTTDLVAGQVNRLCVLFNKVANQLTLRVNGVSGTATTVTEAGSAFNALATSLGGRPSGTVAACPDDTVFSNLRLSRGVQVSAGNQLTSATPKIPFATLFGQPYALPSYAPTVDAAVTCWLAGFMDGGQNIPNERGSAISPGHVGAGYGVTGVTCGITGRMFPAASASRTAQTRYANSIKRNVIAYLRKASNGAAPDWSSGTVFATLDYIQQKGKFAVVFPYLKRIASTAAVQLLVGNQNNNSSQIGFNFRLESTGEFGVTFTNAGGIRHNAVTTGTQFAVGNEYAIVATANGPGTPVEVWWAAWPGHGQPIAAMTKVTLSNVTQTDDTAPTGASTLPVVVGDIQDGNRAAYMDIGDLIFRNDYIANQAAAIQQVNLALYKPTLSPLPYAFLNGAN